jgi:hypothetical protein
VIARPNAVIFFAVFNSFFRVTFEVYGNEFVDVAEGEYFTTNPKDQNVFIEGKVFGNTIFGEAISAIKFDVHR